MWIGLSQKTNLIKTFGFKDAVVLNDFVAMARGATVITDDGFETLISGKENDNAPVAVLGPGTGLGVSCILPGSPPRIIPTEGGHTAFARLKMISRLRSYLIG